MNRSRRIAATVLATAAASVMVAAGAAPAGAATFYSIKNFGSGLCLQPAVLETGSQLVQMPCDAGNPAQRWALNGLGSGNYQFVNQGTGGCMDAHGANADQTPVDTWPCSQISNQRWHVNPSIPNAVPAQITWTNGGRCLDVAGGGTGPNNPIWIYHCSVDNPAQVFTIS